MSAKKNPPQDMNTFQSRRGADTVALKGFIIESIESRN
jgi:hypothetical protein